MKEYYKKTNQLKTSFTLYCLVIVNINQKFISHVTNKHSIERAIEN